MPWYTTNHARRDAERQAKQRKQFMANKSEQPEIASHGVEHSSNAHLDLIGQPWHLYMLHGTDRADVQDFGRACMVAERERIRSKLLEMHERDKHRHNYWHCAVVELFGS